MFIDSSTRKEHGGAVIVLRYPKQAEILQAIQFGYCISNNEVEYEALLIKMCLTLDLSISQLHVYSDSQLVVS